MTTAKKIARRKLSLLQLATELSYVSQACRLMGDSRQPFYEIRRNYQVQGAEGLLDLIPGTQGPHPHRVSQQVEQAILDYSLDYPTQGCPGVAQPLALGNLQVSSSGVRGVWSRHHLLTKQKRLLRPETTVRNRKLQLSQEQIRLLERFSPEFRQRPIQTRFTGDRVAVDTCFVGTLKGLGKIDLQSVIDCRSRQA